MYYQIQQILTHFAAFAILLAVLTKFLWKPFLKLIDERAAANRQELDKALSMQGEFEKLKADYDQRIKGIEASAQAKINEAIAEGQKTRDEILSKANREAEEIRSRVEREVRSKIDAAAIELKEQIIALTLHATEKIIHERLDDNKHRALIGEFVDKMSGARK